MEWRAVGRMLGGCVAALVTAAHAAELLVGPGKAHARIEDALAAARPGDTIVVTPFPGNRPYERVALSVGTPGVTIRAATGAGAPRVPLSGAGFDYSGRGSVPRAIVQFNPGADGCVLEGFDLSNAHNGSRNGAGVRINQANGVTIRACSIHGNDMGIMSNGDGTRLTAVNQLIEGCLISSNGAPEEPGYNHNLYLGGTSATLRGCEVHSSVTGHNVKSRTHLLRVLACYVHDSANREFDLVDAKGDTTEPGSDAVLAGNVIVKAAGCTGNRAVIHLGQDGGNGRDGTLFLIHNTVVTPFVSPVVHLTAPLARVELFNNVVWDGGRMRSGQVLVSAKAAPGASPAGGLCNWVAAGFGGAALEPLGLSQTSVGESGVVLAFAGKGDYRLARYDPRIVDRGCALPAEVLRAIDGRLLEYRLPRATEVRAMEGSPDLGAAEWHGAPGP